MDLEEEARKLGGSSVLRYAPLLAGLVLVILAAGMQAWKRSALEEARGNILGIQYKIAKLEERRDDTDDSKKKDKFAEDIKELQEKSIPDAQKKVASEEVDAANGVWFLAMVQWFGLALASLGLLAIAATGTNHERLGALVGLAFVLTRLA